MSRRGRTVALRKVPTNWRRELSEHVLVSLDGVFTVLDPDEPLPGPRPVGRVMVVMPDFVADTLAHLLADVSVLAGRVGGLDPRAELSELARELAEALYAASAVTGHRCPDGGLRLPDPVP